MNGNQEGEGACEELNGENGNSWREPEHVLPTNATRMKHAAFTASFASFTHDIQQERRESPGQSHRGQHPFTPGSRPSMRGVLLVQPCRKSSTVRVYSSAFCRFERCAASSST
jgi:hypothetical protein